LIVLDASVVVHLVINTSHSEYARAVMKAVAEVAAPDIMTGEVANTLTKMVRTKLLNREQAQSGFQALRRYPITYFRSGELLEKAFSLSLEFNHSVFDCLYVAAALERNVRLITTDQRLVDKFSIPTFSLPPVHLQKWTA
jgi:predicted nucleic acid-binding protein